MSAARTKSSTAVRRDVNRASVAAHAKLVAA